MTEPWVRPSAPRVLVVLTLGVLALAGVLGWAGWTVLT